jgi:hypothetical protein
MGVRILRDPEQRRACMYDSVTETAFGPVLVDPDDLLGDAFIEYVRERTGGDPREVPTDQLALLYTGWQRLREGQAA